MRDWEDFAEEPLELPIGGTVYVVPPIGIKAGLTLRGVVQGEDDSLNDKPATELWRLALGSAYDEMVADDVPMAALNRAGAAALADATHGRAAAVKAWEIGLLPEPLAGQGPAAGTETPRRTRPAGASTTRKRASGTGTTATRKTARR